MHDILGQCYFKTTPKPYLCKSKDIVLKYYFGKKKKNTKTNRTKVLKQLILNVLNIYVHCHMYSRGQLIISLADHRIRYVQIVCVLLWL